MVTHAKVLLWGKTVGLVVWDDQLHRATFQFDRSFTRSELDVAPVMMPLAKARGGEEVFSFGNLRDETFKGLPGLLADCLPDRFGDTLLNALEALPAVQNDRVHLIISDYNMPDMDGLEFLKAVRADPVIGKTVFIMLTGSSEKSVVQKAAELGVNNYVVKPFAPAALKEKIERVFGELS